MKLSVIIPTYNRRDQLAFCLGSLDRQVGAPEFECIVVVDGSTDGTLQMLDDHQVRVVRQPNLGQSAARNAGAAVAEGDVLLFLDDDLEASPGLLRAHAEAQFGGVVFGATEGGGAAGYIERLKRDLTPRWPDDMWCGANCSLPREVFLEAAGFDEQVFPRCCEDIDLGLRLWDQGVEFRYARDARARHHGKHRAGFGYGQALVELCRRYPLYRRHVPMKNWKLHALLGRSWLRGMIHRAGCWRNLDAMFGRRLPVLLYHHVGPPSPETERHRLSIPEAQFERQLDFIQRQGYMTITPSEWLAWVEDGTPLPPKPVMITFDDGYAELAQYAFPKLAKRGMTAALFVMTGGRETWEGKRVFSPEELKSLKGIEIGAHSRTHPDLRLLDERARHDEIAGCREDLPEAAAFAYPYGEYNTEVLEAVNGVFNLAFTCDEGLNSLTTHPLLLKRTEVRPDDSLTDLALRLRFGRSWRK